jgi:hypothetical protein
LGRIYSDTLLSSECLSELHGFSGVQSGADDVRRRSALEAIEYLIPKEVLDIVGAKPGEPELLNRNIVGGKDLLSSLVREDAADVSRQSFSIYQVEFLTFS